MLFQCTEQFNTLHSLPSPNYAAFPIPRSQYILCDDGQVAPTVTRRSDVSIDFTEITEIGRRPSAQFSTLA